jgi:hypothetical protein
MHNRQDHQGAAHTHGHRHPHGHPGRRKGAGQVRRQAQRQDRELCLGLLALIAAGLRDGRLSLAPAPDGRNFEVRALTPDAAALLPPDDGFAALADANPAALAPVLAGLPAYRGRHRRRGARGGPRCLTAISPR